MDIKDLNKSQLLLLALLVSFITSVVTGITVVSLMDQAPKSISTPITKIVKQTVERIVPAESTEALTNEEKKLLEDLKSVQNLSVSVYLKGETENKLLGSGLLLGEDKIILNTVIPEPKENEVYIVNGIMGEHEVVKVSPGDGFTIVQIGKEVKKINEVKEETNNATAQ
ncbi:MAG: hypothetical protein KBC12_03770 [Candidatus Pacebacteria bacterium]|jgi:hypothetical protein|nr:hypothetical protein [Candidatus Paceibacterota bacterium]MBP9851390.1 hypothetical protein [Candidatus Paceibacterota bacterium]